MRRSVVEVVGNLRSLISTKRYAPQDKLPAERMMSARIGCSRATLRAALSILENENMIWRHVGQGTFVGPRPASEPMRHQVLVEMASPADVIGARLLIEPAIAGAAALSATKDDVARLRKLAALTGSARTWHEYERSDDAFHNAIAGSTGNPITKAFLNILSSIRGRARWQRQHDRAFRLARKQEYSNQQGRMHTAIVDAIADHDSERAKVAMFDHLSAIQSIMLRGD